MLPVIALVGRPNVGKSTLFNRLTRSREALVADEPGLTRDRQYGRGHWGGNDFIVVDTGGLSGEADGIDTLIAEQALQAIEEADIVLFLVDARGGMTAADESIASQLRTMGRRALLVVNKAEGLESAMASAEFHALGLGEPHVISAAHGQGVRGLMEVVSAALPEQPEPPDAALDEERPGIRVAVVGRPNVGKSTLVNRMLGEERVVVCDLPGTTRDSIFIPFERDGQSFTLIDTAGVRRRARVTEAVEKFSVIKTLQAIEAAHVVVMVLDARETIAEQDLTLLGHVLEVGKALLLAVNKWDGLDGEQRDRIRNALDRKLSFVDFAKLHFISALHGSGVGNLFTTVTEAYESAMRKLPTPELTRILEEAVVAHAPPLVRGRRIKLRYAHQGGQNPPIVVVHGNQTAQVPDAYRRYLGNTFRKALGLTGTPVRIEFRGGENPYRDKKNVLTDRQVRRRRRNVRRTRKWK